MVAPELIERIRALAEQGISAKKIGEAVHRSKGSVEWICQSRGIKLLGTKGNCLGKGWSPQRRATFERMRADPDQWARYCGKLARSCSKSVMDGEATNCAPDAWEKALAGRTFANVLLVEMPDSRLPQRDASTLQSSMGWCA